MSGEERRAKIIDIINEASTPVSGTSLANNLGVSRQVIVQDIALMRASGCEVISTQRGYILNSPAKVKATFCVSHTDEDMEDELNLFVDYGATVVDVYIEHSLYGHLEAELKLRSRRDVAKFIKGIREGKSSPLMKLTDGVHYHRIEADSKETIDLIENALKEKGYLV